MSIVFIEAMKVEDGRRLTFQLHLQVQVLLDWHNIIPTETSRDWRFAITRKAGIFKCVQDYQIENLMETNLVESFGSAKHSLST